MACSTYLILSLFLVSSFVMPLVDGSGTGELAHLIHESKDYHLLKTFSSFPALFFLYSKHVFLKGKQEATHIHRRGNKLADAIVTDMIS